MADVKIDQSGTEAMVNASLQCKLADAVKSYKTGAAIVQPVLVDLMPEFTIQVSILMVDSPAAPAAS